VFKIGSRQSRNPRNLIDNVLAIDKAISRTSGGEAEKDVVLPIPIGFVMIALGRNRWSNKIAARTCFGKEQIRRIEARVDIQVQLLNVLGSRQGQVGNRQAHGSWTDILKKGSNPGSVGRGGGTTSKNLVKGDRNIRPGRKRTQGPR